MVLCWGCSCWGAHAGVMWSLARLAVSMFDAASRRELQVCCCVTAGDLRLYGEKQRTTCVNGEKRAVHFGAVARPVRACGSFIRWRLALSAQGFRAWPMTRLVTRLAHAVPSGPALVPIHIGDALSRGTFWTSLDAATRPSAADHDGRIAVDWRRGSRGAGRRGSQDQLLRAAQCGEDRHTGRVRRHFEIDNRFL